MPTFRNQMRVKCKLKVAEWVNQLGSCEEKGGVEGQRPCKLTLFGPQYYTVRSYLGNKFTTVSKNLFSMNQLINLFHTIQILALIRYFSLTGNHCISVLYLFFWPVFSCIRSEYGEIQSIQYLVRVFSQNAGKYGLEKLRIWTFFRQCQSACKDCSLLEAALQSCSQEKGFENIQQIYKRTPMPKCRTARQLY